MAVRTSQETGGWDSWNEEQHLKCQTNDVLPNPIKLLSPEPNQQFHPVNQVWKGFVASRFCTQKKDTKGPEKSGDSRIFVVLDSTDLSPAKLVFIVPTENQQMLLQTRCLVHLVSISVHLHPQLILLILIVCPLLLQEPSILPVMTSCLTWWVSFSNSYISYF